MQNVINKGEETVILYTLNIHLGVYILSLSAKHTIVFVAKK
jgi:hypothetical protein